MTSRNKVNKKVLFEAANIKMFYIILFRSLGYGPGLDASANVKDILRRLSKESKRIMLDRWKVVVNPRKLHFGELLLLVEAASCNVIFC